MDGRSNKFGYNPMRPKSFFKNNYRFFLCQKKNGWTIVNASIFVSFVYPKPKQKILCFIGRGRLTTLQRKVDVMRDWQALPVTQFILASFDMFCFVERGVQPLDVRNDSQRGVFNHLTVRKGASNSFRFLVFNIAKAIG